ncbi:MarR family winged helix-turn-helix transcriptional regulator [Caulobacter segnis]
MIDAGEPEEAIGQGVALGGLETSVGFLLRLAQLAVFKDLLAALKPFDLRVTDLSVLLIVEATPGIQQRTIGEALRIQRPNLVTIIDQLEARNLMRRGPVPGDRRAYALSLTPEGEALLRKAKVAHAKHGRKLLDALGDFEAEHMLVALRRIAAL